MDNFMTQVKNLAQSLYPCSAQKLDYDMKLNFLENTSVTCNDGSAAGYVPTEKTHAQRNNSDVIGSPTGQSRVSCAAVHPGAGRDCYFASAGGTSTGYPK